MEQQHPVQVPVVTSSSDRAHEKMPRACRATILYINKAALSPEVQQRLIREVKDRYGIPYQLPPPPSDDTPTQSDS